MDKVRCSVLNGIVLAYSVKELFKKRVLRCTDTFARAPLRRRMRLTSGRLGDKTDVSYGCDVEERYYN